MAHVCLKSPRKKSKALGSLHIRRSFFSVWNTSGAEGLRNAQRRRLPAHTPRRKASRCYKSYPKTFDVFSALACVRKTFRGRALDGTPGGTTLLYEREMRNSPVDAASAKCTMWSQRLSGPSRRSLFSRASGRVWLPALLLLWAPGWRYTLPWLTRERWRSAAGSGAGAREAEGEIAMAWDGHDESTFGEQCTPDSGSCRQHADRLERPGLATGGGLLVARRRRFRPVISKNGRRFDNMTLRGPEWGLGGDDGQPQ